MIDIGNSSKEELLLEFERCSQDWSKYSCDCFGFYISKLGDRIVELGGWPSSKEERDKITEIVNSERKKS